MRESSFFEGCAKIKGAKIKGINVMDYFWLFIFLIFLLIFLIPYLKHFYSNFQCWHLVVFDWRFLEFSDFWRMGMSAVRNASGASSHARILLYIFLFKNKSKLLKDFDSESHLQLFGHNQHLLIFYSIYSSQF